MLWMRHATLELEKHMKWRLKFTSLKYHHFKTHCCKLSFKGYFVNLNNYVNNSFKLIKWKTVFCLFKIPSLTSYGQVDFYLNGLTMNSILRLTIFNFTLWRNWVVANKMLWSLSLQSNIEDLMYLKSWILFDQII